MAGIGVVGVCQAESRMGINNLTLKLSASRFGFHGPQEMLNTFTEGTPSSYEMKKVM